MSYLPKSKRIYYALYKYTSILDISEFRITYMDSPIFIIGVNVSTLYTPNNMYSSSYLLYTYDYITKNDSIYSCRSTIPTDWYKFMWVPYAKSHYLYPLPLSK